MVTYYPDARVYSYVTIQSEYKFSKSYEYHHYRKVEWHDGGIDRDDLRPESKNLLGSIMTLFEIPQNVWRDIEEAHPGFLSEEEYEEIEEMNRMHEQFQKEEEDSIRQDMVARSNVFVEDALVQLDWESMEVLVTGIFSAMGYKARRRPKNNQLGSDISVSPDGLGMVEPVFRIEVKHKNKSKEKVGAPDIRNFESSLRNNVRGIYVSTTGFTLEARYEADRATSQITLIDLEHLVELLLENYEELQPEIKTLVPLKKIYWPL